MQEASLSHTDNSLIELGLNVLGPRWTTPILIELLQGRKRTTQLLKALPGLSAKTLSERLRMLVDFGLITRTVYPEVPPRVEYELNASSAEVIEALRVLKNLGNHLNAEKATSS